MERLRKTIAPLFILAGTIWSCQSEAIIDSKQPSVLHIEAVFFASESLPTITVGQSVNLPGQDMILLDSSDFMLDNAEVRLTWNGKPIPTRQIGQGLYQGVSEAIVSQGDVFNIIVTHDNRTAQATAIVPTIDEKNITSSITDTVTLDESRLTKTIPSDTASDGYTRIDSTIWAGSARVQSTLPQVPDFTYAASYSTRELTLFDSDWNVHIPSWFQSDLFTYNNYDKYYLGENYYGFDQLVINNTNFVIAQSEEDFENGHMSVEINYEIIIPEPIYADYYQLYSTEILPITVTNVENGVGLFIGAVKITQSKNQEINILRGKEYDPEDENHYY
ncbi:hypothetical protein [Reichenbachiella sp. MSK19-1]|uniref:hypothetical protein n=1 Tax=Reichenbachiella sp. MSK19-1 TaxID=1897631 RepID=UPI000E6D395F|nr:hypothetical protein [Reichenbachiella sp. MSK19-1]RJE74837.1 hypothetical protein BGP76_17065 [Reichenbachiella sp. MSK19-1]